MKIFAIALLGLAATSTVSAFVAPQSPAANTNNVGALALSSTEVFQENVVSAVAAPAVDVPTAPSSPELMMPPPIISPLVPTPSTTTAYEEGYNYNNYNGEVSQFRPNTYTYVDAEELAFHRQRIPNPSTFAERQTKPTSLEEIRAQQIQHGLHTTTNYDTTRRCLRN